MFVDVVAGAFWGVGGRARANNVVVTRCIPRIPELAFLAVGCPGVSMWPAARLNARNRLRVRGAMCRGGRARATHIIHKLNSKNSKNSPFGVPDVQGGVRMASRSFGCLEQGL